MVKPIYVDDDAHMELKKRAIDYNMTLQGLVGLIIEFGITHLDDILEGN